MDGKGRLIAFQFNSDQVYALVVTHQKISIYSQGLKIAVLDAPWTAAHIDNLTWTQSADTVLLCHPDVPPQKLVRSDDTAWSLSPWAFYVDASKATRQPYYKFAQDSATIQSDAVSGEVTLTCSQPIFTPGHAGTRMHIRGKEVLIDRFISSAVVIATTVHDLVDTEETVDFHEQAFSPARGFPRCAVFHQDRLVIGGSRDLPNRLWFSRSGDLWNFDKGTGLDDQAIEFGLYSDQINTIRALFSGRHLQVFTSGAEWIVTGIPLTPSSIQLNRQTRIGAIMTRYIPPVDVDGATLFTGRTGRELREFIYADIEQAYQANDLALLARHFIRDPVDQCFDSLQHVLYMVLSDGTVAALTIYRTESVFAWSRLETSGRILSVASVGSHVYALVERKGGIYLERFEDELYLDSVLEGETNAPTAIWSGLEHLEDCDVMVIADGHPVGMKHVTDNQIILDEAARVIKVGLPYTHVIEPLPPSVLNLDGNGRAIRLTRLVLRMHETRALSLDTGAGLRSIALRKMFETEFDRASPPYSGDVTIHAFGWSQDNTRSLWRLEQDNPLPCTVLGATMEIKVNN